MSDTQKTPSKRFTITAALPYANGPIHIGHVAGVYLFADIYARHQRLKGHEVAFISGSDEGGAAITLQARKLATTPQALVDKFHHLNKKTLKKLGISFDIFSRTSSSHHCRIAQQFFKEMDKKGCFEEATTAQFYDTEAKVFLADRYLKGTCPKCNFEQAHGDQCEKCGNTLSSDELLQPISVVSQTTPIKKKSHHWYFPLQRYEKWLKKWILEDHQEWKPNVYGQCKSWLTKGLVSRAITRDLDWGVPLPIKNMEGKVLYVWFEAPIGYISATQEWAKKVGKDWEPFWKDTSTKLVHFIGKDNIVFHCIIFPAMLKAHGDYILPTNVPANEFMQLEGEKFSTSRNHAIWLHEYLAKNPGKEDILRYVLCANAPETKDGNFSWEDFIAKNNNELVSTLGNFIHRTQVLLAKYFERKVPRPSQFEPIDERTLKTLDAIPEAISTALEEFKFKKALSFWMDIARLGNKYLAETTPWAIAKTDQARTGTILHVAMQLVAAIAQFGEPFLPFTCLELQKALSITHHATYPSSKASMLLIPGQLIEKIALPFEKIADKEALGY